MAPPRPPDAPLPLPPPAPGLAALALFWSGLVVGVSFVSTPAKFLAPSITLPVAVDIGRATFGVFCWMELVAALAVAALAVRLGRGLALVAATLLALVLAKVLWLLPLLDARAEHVIQGRVHETSNLHWVYIAADLCQLLLLAWLAWRALRSHGPAATM